ALMSPLFVLLCDVPGASRHPARTDARLQSKRASVLLESPMPVEPVGPGLGDATRGIDPECDYRQPRRLDRLLSDLHACLLRCAVALLLVAVVASHHDVLPRGPSALRPRNNVIIGQATQRELVTAVLASEVVTRCDVDPRKLYRPLATTNRPQHPDDGGHLDRDAHRADVLVVLFDDFDLPVEQHHDGPLPTDDSVGLIPLV